MRDRKVVTMSGGEFSHPTYASTDASSAELYDAQKQPRALERRKFKRSTKAWLAALALTAMVFTGFGVEQGKESQQASIKSLKSEKTNIIQANNNLAKQLDGANQTVAEQNYSYIADRLVKTTMDNIIAPAPLCVFQGTAEVTLDGVTSKYRNPIVFDTALVDTPLDSTPEGQVDGLVGRSGPGEIFGEEADFNAYAFGPAAIAGKSLQVVFRDNAGQIVKDADIMTTCTLQVLTTRQEADGLVLQTPDGTEVGTNLTPQLL